jgi:hypothetical protein
MAGTTMATEAYYFGPLGWFLRRERGKQEPRQKSSEQWQITNKPNFI